MVTARPTLSEPEFDDREIRRFATALSNAGSPDQVGAAVAQCGPGAAGAVFANLAMFDDLANRVRMVHGELADPSIASRWSEFGIDEPTPLCEAILTGHPVLEPSLGAIAANYPNLLSDTVAAGLEATASVPLRSRAGSTIGAIGLGWRHPQAFASPQMGRLTLLAQLVAEALERANTTPLTVGAAVERAEARILQEAFLPASLPRTEHLDVAAAYLPANDAPMGGDWYDAFPVDGGTCLVIGDVAGHGARSVAVMALVRNAVRAFADEDPTPHRIMSRVNRMLCRLQPDETATLIVAVWRPDTRTLVRTSAGHPPILRCRPGEFAFLAAGAGQGVMIGVDPHRRYGEEVKVMRPGTTLLFYTDGLVEARREDFATGMERLRVFAEGRTDLSPQSLCDDVLTWRVMQGPREDDLCVVAARMA